MSGVKKMLATLPNLPRAACRDIEDKDFFMVSDHEMQERLPELRALCGSCVEVAKCLRYALEQRESEGFWGGKTPKERRSLLRGKRFAKPPKEDRGMLILQFRERGATYDEIAKHFEITKENAIQLGVRARKRLKEAQ